MAIGQNELFLLSIKNTLESYVSRVFCRIHMKFSKIYSTNGDMQLSKNCRQWTILNYLKNRPTTGNLAPSFLLSPFSRIIITT